MRIINSIKKYGIFGTIIKILNKVSYRIFLFFNKLDVKITKKRNKKQEKKSYDYLLNKINDSKYKYIFVFFPYVEWNLPIFQRPQQIALEFSKRGDILYFFCSPNSQYDNIKGVYKKINNNLFVVKDFEYLCNIKTDKRVLHLYSTDTISDYSVVQEALKRNDKVLYEYIDEIHEEITYHLPKKYLEKHKKILKNEKCYIITTADKLYNNVKQIRKKRFALSTNGVNIEDFLNQPTDEIPEIIKKIKSKYDRIICYYGALATWFDYKLIKKVAEKYPNYAIVLIGVEYDNSYKNSKLDKINNIFYLGKINYYELHKYSENADLLTIPFLINEITESTSPVKLFEYMATNIPILTTDMPECKKYNSVIIGKNHADFIDKINTTMNLINSPEYLELEMQEAKKNTWKEKANIIIDLLNEEGENKYNENNKKN